MNCSILTFPYHLYIFIQSFWIDNGPSAVAGCHFRSFKMSFSHNSVFLFTFNGIYAFIRTIMRTIIRVGSLYVCRLYDGCVISTIETSRIINYSKRIKCSSSSLHNIQVSKWPPKSRTKHSLIKFTRFAKCNRQTHSLNVDWILLLVNGNSDFFRIEVC